MKISENQQEIRLFNPVITALFGIVCLPVACYFYAKNCQTLNQDKNRLANLYFAVIYLFCLIIYYIVVSILSVYNLDEIILMFDKGYYKFFWLYSLLLWWSILGKPQKDYIKQNYPNYQKRNIVFVILSVTITRIAFYVISLFILIFIHWLIV